MRKTKKGWTWNPKTWYQWLLGSLIFIVPTLAIFWLLMFVGWAS